MSFDRIKKRWRALFRRDELERDLDAELRFHSRTRRYGLGMLPVQHPLQLSDLPVEFTR